MKMKTLLSPIVCTLFFLGCSTTQYYFAPKEPTPLTPRAYLGATFAIPEGQMKGFLRIFPTGVEKVNGKWVLPVRYYLENTDTTPWRVDVSHQKVKFPDLPLEVTATISNGRFQTPIMEIPKGQDRVWDIFFAVPDSIRKSTDLAEFSISWEVIAQPAPVTGTTAFVPAILPEEGPSYNSAPFRRSVWH